jgi:hypothetical protein
MRSRTVGMPNGRFSRLPGFSIHTRRTGCGSYRSSRNRRSMTGSSWASRCRMAWVVIPSTPAARSLFVTDANASARVFGEKTLSMSVCHCLASFPLPRAASIRSVQTRVESCESRSVPHSGSRLLPFRVAFAGTSDGVGGPVCSFAVFIFLPPLAPR